MNKKGNTIVEAALIFPVVILAVMALIYMMIFFYQQTETRVRMHIALRVESGSICKTIQYLKINEPPFPVYQKGLYLSCYGKQQEGAGLLGSMEKELYARKYLDDERLFVRSADLIKPEKNNEKQ